MMYSKECWLVHKADQAVTDSVTAFFYALVPAVLVRGMSALLKSRQNRCSKQRKAVFLW